MRPLLKEPVSMQADPPANPRTPVVVDSDLNTLQSVLNGLARTDGGQLPTNEDITKLQAEQLDAAVGQALEGLSEIPGMLETMNTPAIAAIPRSGVKLDQ
jgi:hypothetical protein